VATSVPHWAYVSKGLKAVRPPLESDSERTQSLLDSVPVAYIVLNGEEDGKAVAEYTAPFVEGSPHAWRCVYVDEHGLARIFRRIRPDDDDTRAHGVNTRCSPT